MIFVTVGNMDSFDRLIKAVDRWKAQSRFTEPLLVQIAKGAYQPTNCECVRFLTPSLYQQAFEQARLVISHAGMGTIITALELKKPLVVMPRRATFGETRNEHQLATIRHFRERSKLIAVADTELELPSVLDRALTSSTELEVASASAEPWPPDESLIQFVRDFVS